MLAIAKHRSTHKILRSSIIKYIQYMIACMGKTCGIPKSSCYYRKQCGATLHKLFFVACLPACPKVLLSTCCRQNILFLHVHYYPVPLSICKRIGNSKTSADMGPRPGHPMTDSPASRPPSEKQELAHMYFNIFMRLGLFGLKLPKHKLYMYHIHMQSYTQ